MIAVTVEIGGDYAVGPAGIRQAGLFGYVRESAVAIVAIESATRGMRVVGGVHGERIREINVHTAIIVVVEEGNPAANRFDDILFFRSGDMPEGNAGEVRYFRKVNGGFFLVR